MTRRACRGAALLLAMIVLTMVATVAAGMIWQQRGAVYVESAERTSTQMRWMLDGAIDWGRLVVRRLAKPKPSNGVAWGFELHEMRLAELLAADRDNNADATLDAFVKGDIEDAQSRYNLRNVIDDKGEEIAVEVEALERVCALAGASGVAPTLVAAMKAAHSAALNASTPQSATAAAYPISRMEHLRWLGVEEATLKQLMRVMDLLPERTPLNLNSASVDVVDAVLGINRGLAAQLSRVNAGQLGRFDTLADAQALAGLDNKALPAGRFDVLTTWYYLNGSLRFEDRALAVRALVKQTGQGQGSTVQIRRLDRIPLRRNQRTDADRS